MIFSKANLLVGKMASNDPHDPHLNCVHLNADGSSVATNGRMLMAVGPINKDIVKYPPVRDQASPSTAGISVSLETLDRVMRILPKEKKPHLQFAALTAARNPEHIELTTTDLVHEQKVSSLPKAEIYPEWQKIVQKASGEPQEQVRVCLRRSDLIDLLRALEEACPDKGNSDPVYIEINPESKGVIMRCVSRETGQRVIGAMTALNTKDQWLPCDEWERSVFARVAAVKKKLPIVRD